MKLRVWRSGTIGQLFKDRKDYVRATLLVGAIVIVSLLHYFTPPSHIWLHPLLQRAYYIPILLMAVWFGWRGGIAAAAITSMFYVPFARRDSTVLLGGESGTGKELLAKAILYTAIWLYLKTISRRRIPKMKQHKSSSHRQRGDAAISGLLALALVATGMLYLNFRNHFMDASNSVAPNPVKTVAAVPSSNNAPHLVYAAFSMPAPAAKSDNPAALIKKGKQLFQAHTCSACHGPKAEGTAIAPPLAGIGHYFNEATFSSLIHHPRPQMSAKGMPPAPLSDEQTHALWTYLNSMPVPAHRGPGVPAVVIFK